MVLAGFAVLAACWERGPTVSNRVYTIGTDNSYPYQSPEG